MSDTPSEAVLTRDTPAEAVSMRSDRINPCKAFRHLKIRLGEPALDAMTQSHSLKFSTLR